MRVRNRDCRDVKIRFSCSFVEETYRLIGNYSVVREGFRDSRGRFGFGGEGVRCVVEFIYRVEVLFIWSSD